MSLLEIVREVRRRLEESGRLSYQIPRREISLNDDTLAAVIVELVDHQHVAIREDQALARSAAAVLSQARAEGSLAPFERDPHASPPQHLTDRILHSKAALEGERKQVTVLFSDVSGFAAISENLDPEDVHVITATRLCRAMDMPLWLRQTASSLRELGRERESLHG